MADFEKSTNNIKITLDIDAQLTWGELFDFVDRARESVNPGAPVGLEFDSLGNQELEGLSFYVEHLPPRPGGPLGVVSAD